MIKIITLKDMAEAGYIMGLATIGEVATHMQLHYGVYFSIEHFDSELHDFQAMIAGHEDKSIFDFLTQEDKTKMDDELEKAFGQADAMKDDEATGEWPAPEIAD